MKRLATYIVLLDLIYLTTVYIQSYHINNNAQGFNVVIECADQSEACEDALEDLQANILE